MERLSFFLFARPSFAEGATRIVDWANALNEYNTSLSAEQADRIASRLDRLVLTSELSAARKKILEMHLNKFLEQYQEYYAQLNGK